MQVMGIFQFLIIRKDFYMKNIKMGYFKLSKPKKYTIIGIPLKIEIKGKMTILGSLGLFMIKFGIWIISISFFKFKIN